MNIYFVTLHTETGNEFQMPYYFTNEKKAYLYGEYKFRTSKFIRSYKVNKLETLWPFYILK